jgi:hypothetical protein
VAEEQELKLFGEDGLIFDHTNPMDYLSFVPGIGAVGLGAKALSVLNKVNKLKKLPKTQYHGGHSSIEQKAADKVGVYSSPDARYASLYARDRLEEDVKKYGPTGLYKLDLSKAKNIELTNKPSKKLKTAIEKYKKANPDPYDEIHHGLNWLFGKTRSQGVQGSKPLLAGRETLDWLRGQGVEMLTDSKTFRKGARAKGTDAEYFLLKDFPKKKLSDEEVEKIKSARRFNIGGLASNNTQDFLDAANEVIALEQQIEMPKAYREGGRVRLI